LGVQWVRGYERKRKRDIGKRRMGGEKEEEGAGDRGERGKRERGKR
jgi:hypothetical protein